MNEFTDEYMRQVVPLLWLHMLKLISISKLGTHILHLSRVCYSSGVQATSATMTNEWLSEKRPLDSKTLHALFWALLNLRC